MKASPPERQHASYLRRLLAENNIDYDKLKETYEQGGKPGLEKILKEEVSQLVRYLCIIGLSSVWLKIVNAKEEDLIELLVILDCFFDPDKQPVKPKTTWSRYPPNRRARPRSFSKGGKNRSKSRSQKESETKDDVKIEIKSEESTVLASSESENAPSVETSPRTDPVKVEVPAN